MWIGMGLSWGLIEGVRENAKTCFSEGRTCRASFNGHLFHITRAEVQPM